MASGADGQWVSTFVLILIAANLLAAVVGVLMMFPRPGHSNFFKYGDRWISTRKLLKPFEIPRAADAKIMRYPRVLGLALSIGAAFIVIKLGVLLLNYRAVEGGQLLARVFNISLDAPLWESLWITTLVLLLVGAVAAVLLGLAAVFNVGLIERLSARANRWVSTRRALKPLETPYYGFDTWVAKKPRLWGGVIVLAALYTAVVLFWFSRLA